MSYKKTREKWNILYKKVSPIIMTLIFLALAIYGIYITISQNKIKIQYEILSSTNVLDINEDIEKLKILYDDEDLREKDKNLKIINLKIKNIGKGDILSTYYDDNDLLGFSVVDGKIIKEPEILETSNKYLGDYINIIKLVEGSQARLSKVIFDASDYVIFKIFILHSSDIEPSIIPIGKIAGADISIIDSAPLKEESFVEQSFHGNIWIQVARAVVYFIIVLLIILGIAYIVNRILKVKNRRKRSKIVNEFKGLSYYNYKKVDDIIFDQFKTDGITLVAPIDEVIRKEKLLKDIYSVYLENKDNIKDEKALGFNFILKPGQSRGSDTILVKKILESGFAIEKDGNEIEIIADKQKTLRKFIEFIDRKYKKKDSFPDYFYNY